MNLSHHSNITDHLYKFADSNPEKEAFLHPVNMNFGKLIRIIDRYAEGFRLLGISNGTRTIVLISPGVDLFAITFALFRIGAIPVMIDPGMGIGRMARALKSIKADAFVGIPKSHLLRYIYPGAFDSIQVWISTGILRFLGGYSIRNMAHIDYRSVAFPVQPDDEAALFFTSGSTGPPKGVIYNIRNLEAQMEYLKNHFKYNSDEVDLCTFPLIGLLIICQGISIVLADMDMMHPVRLNPRKVLKNIMDYGCTHMFCSPMVLKRLADYGVDKKIKVLSLKRIMTAGAPVSPLILNDFRKLLSSHAEIHTPYGATEALPVTDITDSELLGLYDETGFYRNGVCVGYPLEGIEIRIISISDDPVSSFEEAEILENGEIGEIVLTGPNVTEAYGSDPEANKLAKVYDPQTLKTWHRMGDLGKMDAQGKLWYYGRKAQRIITDGTTLYTILVEAVFNQHPDVARTALVGIQKRDGSGIVPVICVELVENKKRRIYLQEELRSMASVHEITGNINYFLFHSSFPVDPRHNAKIYREKLAKWANNKLSI